MLYIVTDCPELIKEFYIEAPEVAMMSKEEADQIRLQNNNITVNDLTDSENKRPTPNPCIKFEQAFEHYRKYGNMFAITKMNQLKTASPCCSISIRLLQ